MTSSSHTDLSGKAKMVDVSDKQITSRSTTASVTVRLNADAFLAVRENKAAKGDVLAVANIAGVQAAKKTAELIPLCHQVPLDSVTLRFDLDEKSLTILIHGLVVSSAKTGVEMEALTACSVAALTVYDMLKSVQKDIVIDNLMLLEKKGGKSGGFIRPDSQNFDI